MPSQRKTEKTCSRCKETKSIEHFARGRRNPSPFCHACRPAAVEETRRLRVGRHRATSRQNAEKEMWWQARSRSKRYGIPFSIEEWHVCIPKFCPVFGFPLVVASGISNHSSPTLDRIIPSKGYVPGNIIVVSKKANQMKSDATVSEIRRLAKFYGDVIKGIEPHGFGR